MYSGVRLQHTSRFSIFLDIANGSSPTIRQNHKLSEFITVVITAHYMVDMDEFPIDCTQEINELETKI